MAEKLSTWRSRLNHFGNTLSFSICQPKQSWTWLLFWIWLAVSMSLAAWRPWWHIHSLQHSFCDKWWWQRALCATDWSRFQCISQVILRKEVWTAMQVAGCFWWKRYYLSQIPVDFELKISTFWKSIFVISFCFGDSHISSFYWFWELLETNSHFRIFKKFLFHYYAKNIACIHILLHQQSLNKIQQRVSEGLHSVFPGIPATCIRVIIVKAFTMPVASFGRVSKGGYTRFQVCLWLVFRVQCGNLPGSSRFRFLGRRLGARRR